MTTTLNRFSMATLAASTLVAVGAFSTESAHAFTIFTDNCDYSGALYCSDVFSGNDSNTAFNDPDKGLWAFLQAINDFVAPSAPLVANPTTWGNAGLPSGESFITKVEAPEGRSTTSTVEGLLGYLSIGYDQDPKDSTSGTWKVINLSLDSGKFDGPFVLSMKAGDAFAFNYFDGTIQEGTWSTSAFGKGFSHATLYSTPESIPTPALLPGLIGMGVAALRKRNQGESESA